MPVRNDSNVSEVIIATAELVVTVLGENEVEEEEVEKDDTAAAVVVVVVQRQGE
jgi:hypothetical protein